jgi:hypothetical protein
MKTKQEAIYRGVWPGLGMMYNIKVKTGYTTIIVKPGEDLKKRTKDIQAKFLIKNISIPTSAKGCWWIGWGWAVCFVSEEKLNGSAAFHGRDPMSETTETHSGFHILQTKVELPFNNASVDPQLQMDLLICHLFVNDKRSIPAITLIGEDSRSIIQALLRQKVIKDRRRDSHAKQHWRAAIVKP